MLDRIPTSTHHHGGRLLFDADGMLLVADRRRRAVGTWPRTADSLAGKILRIRPDGRAAPGNPFDNRTWSYGHRNVEGLAFDADGRLWATEFGDKEADELNLIVKGEQLRLAGRRGCARTTTTSPTPKATWSPTSSCSPAGIAITRSTAFIGALQGQCLFAVPLDGTEGRQAQGATSPTTTAGSARVAVAPDGALWMTTSNTDGRVDPGQERRQDPAGHPVVTGAPYPDPVTHDPR